MKAGFVVNPRARLIRKLTATYLQPPLPVTVTSSLASVSYRTKVVLTDTVRAGGRGQESTADSLASQGEPGAETAKTRQALLPLP